MSIDSLIWGTSLVVSAGLLIAYGLTFRARNRLHVERKAEAVRLGIDRPLAQYPFVDPGLCIGCATCVTACPEGDVLGS
ncbi:MAG: 4Fe-4S binding protein [Candidatus Schekmanbacteria bacterium]|nr:4Fe-4S binding protein [Candidatus Schekmanbacteria bacterium]